jgi:threonine dehydrogenase-like Zn-dependent dehydrogenase
MPDMNAADFTGPGEAVVKITMTTNCGTDVHILNLDGHRAQCGGHAIGGWRFGNCIDGCQAGYVRVSCAMANLAPHPDGLSDEQLQMCPDIMDAVAAGPPEGSTCSRWSLTASASGRSRKPVTCSPKGAMAF